MYFGRSFEADNYLDNLKPKAFVEVLFANGEEVHCSAFMAKELIVNLPFRFFPVSIVPMGRFFIGGVRTDKEEE